MGKIIGLVGIFYVAVIAAYLSLSGLAVQFLLNHWLHKQVSFVISVVIGFFLGEIAIPAAIVTWLLGLAGVA